MGAEKALLPLGGRPLLAHVVERIRPQVAALILNANGDVARFAGFGLPVVADALPGNLGPLAGVLAGLDWAARERPSTTHVASVACDVPFLPGDLVRRLVEAIAAGEGGLACAASEGRTHPVFALWPVALRGELRRALEDEGVRKVDAFTARHATATVDFAATPFDPFLNINGPEDMSRAEGLLALAASRRDSKMGASEGMN